MDVSDAIASIGFCPDFTRSSTSRMFWPCAPATASVPITIFSPGVFSAAREHRVLQAERLLHRGEALLGVVADAEEPRLVLEVVLRHQPDVGVEVDAARRRAASRPRAWPGRRARPPCSRPGPPASSTPGLCACTIDRRPCDLASPHAASTCSCDSVGTPPSRMLAEAKIFTRSAPSAFSFRTSARISSGVSLGLLIWPSELSSRGPGSTPRAIASRSDLVARRADALDGREAGHQRDVGVLGGVQRVLFRRLGPGVVAALGVEVPVDVHVRVDEARAAAWRRRGRSSRRPLRRPDADDAFPSRTVTTAFSIAPPVPSMTRWALMVMVDDCARPVRGRTQMAPG